MLRINLKTAFALLCCHLLCSTAQAWSFDDLSGIELSAGIAATRTHAGNGATEITTEETDTDLVNSINHSATYQIGVGYHLFPQALQNQKFFNDWLIQLNLSQSNQTIAGHALEFGLNDSDAFSFTAPIRSTTLMLDIKPTLFTVQHFSPYPVLGAGIGWNRGSFSEQAFSSQDADGAITLPDHTQKNFVYEVGFGVRDAVTKNMNISLEYLSTYLGKMTPSMVSTSAQTVQSAPSFSMRNQKLLLALGWTF